jgi:hypothetical protein
MDVVVLRRDGLPDDSAESGKQPFPLVGTPSVTFLNVQSEIKFAIGTSGEIERLNWKNREIAIRRA